MACERFTRDGTDFEIGEPVIKNRVVTCLVTRTFSCTSIGKIPERPTLAELGAGDAIKVEKINIDMPAPFRLTDGSIAYRANGSISFEIPMIEKLK